jgi:peptidoglycan/LPS O-acetylase OafA/YrhL
MRSALAHPSVKKKRIPVLDGWRGVSILLVLAGHMLPLSPKWLHLNFAVSAAGLSIFFFLSGFLVASMLLANDNVASFFVRRLFRIVPLAWLAVLVLLAIEMPSSRIWLANLLFYANVSDGLLPQYGEHLWSLSVEVQFYLIVGLGVATLGRRSLYLLPIACVAVTVARIGYGMETSIVTWFRVDEILVGSTTALLMHHRGGAEGHRQWPLSITLILFAALFLSCHPAMAELNYLRPYITAALVYSTFGSGDGILMRMLSSKALKYCAEISYALYVVHPLTYAGWLGEGDVFVKYAKRLLVSFPLTFALAHLSSRYYERYFNRLGHTWAARIETSGSVELGASTGRG